MTETSKLSDNIINIEDPINNKSKYIAVSQVDTPDIFNKNTFLINISILLIIVGIIVNDVIINDVIKWFIKNTTENKSPDDTIAILSYIIDGIFGIGYMNIIITIINQMIEQRNHSRFNGMHCIIIFIYLIIWTPKIIVYVNIVSYMKQEQYYSLKSFENIIIEFIIGVSIYFLIHIFHIFTIIKFYMKMTKYRITQKLNSTMSSIECCC